MKSQPARFHLSTRVLTVFCRCSWLRNVSTESLFLPVPIDARYACGSPAGVKSGVLVPWAYWLLFDHGAGLVLPVWGAEAGGGGVG